MKVVVSPVSDFLKTARISPGCIIIGAVDVAGHTLPHHLREPMSSGSSLKLIRAISSPAGMYFLHKRKPLDQPMPPSDKPARQRRPTGGRQLRFGFRH
jgi:hypothetical protein